MVLMKFYAMFVLGICQGETNDKEEMVCTDAESGMLQYTLILITDNLALVTYCICILFKHTKQLDQHAS